jgi:hypothetical protein
MGRKTDAHLANVKSALEAYADAEEATFEASDELIQCVQEALEARDATIAFYEGAHKAKSEAYENREKASAAYDTAFKENNKDPSKCQKELKKATDASDVYRKADARVQGVIAAMAETRKKHLTIVRDRYAKLEGKKRTFTDEWLATDKAVKTLHEFIAQRKKKTASSAKKDTLQALDDETDRTMEVLRKSAAGMDEIAKDAKGSLELLDQAFQTDRSMYE